MNRPLLTAALVAAVTLSGCSAVQEEDGKALLPQIAIGECTNLEFPEQDATAEVADITKVDCGEAHKWETFADKRLDLDGEYPGDEGMAAIAEEFCYAEFEPFVGVSYDDSVLDMTYLTPTPDGWAQLRDRTITCFVGSEAGDITGTLKGSNR